MHSIQIDAVDVFSVFQPIYSFSNQACVGAEALIRGTDLTTKESLGAYACLQHLSQSDVADVRRDLNRLHLRSWQNSEVLSKNWVFLNLDFDGLQNIDELCLQELIVDLDLNGQALVIEVVENEIRDEALFESLIKRLRGLGCLIALDDFGAAHSNIDRIWKAEPDIVKLDRQVLLEATKSLRSESVLRNLTKLIQQSGSICLLEGIETHEQALLAMDVGVDLVQGFYFAKPSQSAQGVSKGEALIQQITEDYPLYLTEKSFRFSIQKKGYEALFERLSGLTKSDDVETQMQIMSELSFVKRFFILDEQGYQVSDENLVQEEGSQERQCLFKQGKGLCWKNRHYFIKAMQNVDEIYVSKPYRSLIDVALCLTISKRLELATGEVIVACFDVYYHDKSTDSVQIST